MRPNEQYKLSWDSYQNNICKGLGLLQERGEFVDMTLAADGYFVKVHKMVMSLVSPYIKDLISSADCPHPVIFLNNITYPTLCSMLEYIYTGQASVTREKLRDVIQAGKSLRIKGLMDMLDSSEASRVENELATLEMNEMSPVQTTDAIDDIEILSDENLMNDIEILDGDSISSSLIETISKEIVTESCELASLREEVLPKPKDHTAGDNNVLQYTMSNQGSLQMILNRYLYNVRYSYKNSNRRMWRCIFYPKKLRCPAFVITENEEIVERCCTHNHTFHDDNIMRKIRDGKVFTVLKEAQLQLELQKRGKKSTKKDESDSQDTE